MKELKGNVTISKTYSGDGQHMEIRIQDENSRAIFVIAKMSMEEFAHAITGLADRPVNMKVRGLENVGKMKEQKELVFPISSYAAHNEAEEKCQQYTDEGWKANNYFRSQKSFFSEGIAGAQVYFARTSQFRYVEVESESETEG